MFIWSGKKREWNEREGLAVRQTDVLLGDCVSCMALSDGFKALIHSLARLSFGVFHPQNSRLVLLHLFFLFPCRNYYFTLQICMMPV